jgi:hypothetical protein
MFSAYPLGPPQLSTQQFITLSSPPALYFGQLKTLSCDQYRNPKLKILKSSDGEKHINSKSGYIPLDLFQT